jgi:imidazolonepropionase-like amidohydrolase
MNQSRIVLRWVLRIGAFLFAFGVVAVGASVPYAMLVGFDPGTRGVAADSTLIANVDVLTMADRVIRRDQFVVIEKGRVVSMANTAPATPARYTVIDGHGLTLMPGLIDMHTHIFDRTDLVNYLAAGVTTVRNMMGMPMHLRWRAEVASGALPGPRLVTASPTLNGGDFAPFHVFPRDATEARALVRRYRACGYDFIKVYDGLAPGVFAAVIAEARNAGLDVAGHPPRALAFGDVLAANMISIEHAEEIYSALLKDDGADARLDSIVDQLAASQTALVPTLIAYRNLQRAHADPTTFLASVDMARINPVVRFFGHRAISDIVTSGKPERIARKMRLMTELTRRLYKRGGPMLLGTDTGPAFTVAGRSFHDEIALNAAAGIDAHALLFSATRAPAQALRQDGEIGVVAPGARAELILVAGDPLRDLSILRRPRGVLMNGRFYDRAALDALEQSGTHVMSSYATMGWLLWHQVTGGGSCGSD